jgi:hypothetical protein
MNYNDQNLVFDNEYYYSLYPDVAKAVKDSTFLDGEEHFLKHGQREGRKYQYRDKTKEAIEEQNPGWSGHLTLNGYVEPVRNQFVNMVDVPTEFRQVQDIEYPKGNKQPFEQYFCDKFKEIKPNTFRIYLPIFWTSYYVNNKYGQDASALKYLQTYLDTLDKTKKYFTIIQYDDGILNDISGLDILVYSMGCKKPGYYPLPLISQPLNNNPLPEYEKTIDFSFFGADTHPIRKQMVKAFGDSNVRLSDLSIDKYYDVLKKTRFALCPRGYGITSFRMFEAMALGCIPVYISNEFWEPFNLPFDYGIKLTPEQLPEAKKIILQADYNALKAKSKEVHEKYFVYSQCANAIIKTLT